jgi:hypothetical protein
MERSKWIFDNFGNSMAPLKRSKCERQCKFKVNLSEYETKLHKNQV